MYTAADLKKGLKIEIDGQPWLITVFEFNKPGKGQSIYKCRLRNMINGSGMERSFRSADKIEKPNLFQRQMSYSYHDGHYFVFSDLETFEEVQMSDETIGDAKKFLVENMEVEVLFFNDIPIEIVLPIFVVKEVVRSEPGARGDTTTNVTKPAWIDSGHEIAVPLFINEGDMVKIDTRTGEYVERVNIKK